jgi:hypothetical protein
VTVGRIGGAVRKVRRRYGRPAVVIPKPKMKDYPNVDTDIRTLRARLAALQDGDSLYPWARTKLKIANGKRLWVAKDSEDY